MGLQHEYKYVVIFFFCIFFFALLLLLYTLHCQWHSQDGIVFTYAQENFSRVSLPKLGLFLKERLCLQREQKFFFFFFFFFFSPAPMIKGEIILADLTLLCSQL